MSTAKEIALDYNNTVDRELANSVIQLEKKNNSLTKVRSDQRQKESEVEQMNNEVSDREDEVRKANSKLEDSQSTVEETEPRNKALYVGGAVLGGIGFGALIVATGGAALAAGGVAAVAGTTTAGISVAEIAKNRQHLRLCKERYDAVREKLRKKERKLSELKKDSDKISGEIRALKRERESLQERLHEIANYCEFIKKCAHFVTKCRGAIQTMKSSNVYNTDPIISSVVAIESYFRDRRDQCYLASSKLSQNVPNLGVFLGQVDVLRRLSLTSPDVTFPIEDEDQWS